MKSKTAAPRDMASPYTAKNIDEALTHLERVLAIKDATTVLGRHYWQARVAQISATSALTPGQRARVERLHGLLKDAEVGKYES
jgi:hypothetical protein